MAEITGFTLFYTYPVKNGWQMSVQRKEEPGWSITMIPEAQARIILDLLKNSGHPDGPWEIRKPGRTEDAIEEAIEAQARIILDLLKNSGSIEDDIARAIEARRAWTAAL